MQTENDVFELPDSIKADLQEFADTIAADLPDNVIFKNMGLSNVTAENVYKQIVKSFQLNGK